MELVCEARDGEAWGRRDLCQEVVRFVVAVCVLWLIVWCFVSIT